MSDSTIINYFFNSNKSLPKLAAEISEAVGYSLAPSPGLPESVFTVSPFFGMQLDLVINDKSEQGYEDDDDGEFQYRQYDYEFVAIFGEQTDVKPIQLPILLSAVDLLHRKYGITGMLVYNFEVLLAKYEERAVNKDRSELYDTVSKTSFNTLANHLAVVQKRLPGNEVKRLNSTYIIRSSPDDLLH